MHQELFSIGGLITFHTYGILIAIGFAVAVWLTVRDAARFGIPPKDIINLIIPILISSLFGARLLYVLTNLTHFTDRFSGGDYFAVFKVYEGGLVFYGGMITGLSTALFILLKRKIPVWIVGDLMALTLPLAHAFGRLGCFGAGCCYGHVTDSAIGVNFPENSIAWVDQVNHGMITETATHSLAIHPTQLYESFGLALIFIFLWWYRSRKQFHGELLLIYLILYPIERSIVEIFRGDAIRRHLFEWVSPSFNSALGLPEGSAILMSTSQFISLLLFGFAIGMRIWIKRKQKNSREKT